jgi:hypothetical protein
MNMTKSSVLSIRCGQINLDEILSNFPGEISSFPTTYLGLPLTLGQLIITHLQSCLDRATGKLAGWQGLLLNQGGRRELVKTVLSTLPTHLLAVIKPPKKFYKDFDKLRRCFLWVGDHEIHGGKCKVNWSRVCRSLNYGGLGLTDLERFGSIYSCQNTHWKSCKVLDFKLGSAVSPRLQCFRGCITVAGTNGDQFEKPFRTTIGSGISSMISQHQRLQIM